MFGLCEETGIIGAFCTLIVPYRGYTEGTVIEERTSSPFPETCRQMEPQQLQPALQVPQFHGTHVICPAGSIHRRQHFT